MIIACPACATRYVVPDTAVGVDGRTVRCAKCRHSWFQEGPELVGAEARGAARSAQAAAPRSQTPAQAPAQSAVSPPPAEKPRSEPVSSPARTQPRPEPEVAAAAAASASPAMPQAPAREVPAEPVFQRAAPNFAGDTFDDAGQAEADDSAFVYAPPFRPRRNWTRMWSFAAVLFAAISLGLVGAVAWYGMPDWMPMARPLFAEAQPDLIIEFPPDQQDRRTLPNGTAFFGASGRITNVGPTRRTVPMILIVLRDVEDRIVYTQPVAPPKRQLGPGESVTINEALTDVPNSAKYAEFGWKPG